MTETMFLGVLKTIRCNMRRGDKSLSSLLDKCIHTADRGDNAICNAHLDFLLGEFYCNTGRVEESLRKLYTASEALFECGEISDWVECSLQYIHALFEVSNMSQALKKCEEVSGRSE